MRFNICPRKTFITNWSKRLSSKRVGSLVMEDYALSIIVFDESKEEIVKWIT